MPGHDADRFQARYGPWALVAGGSQGLGAEFASQLARRGLNLVLVAEAADPLEAVAGSVGRDHGVEVRAVVADLADPAAPRQVEAATRGIEVGLLVCNAAHAPIGPFLSRSLEDQLQVVAVNCRAPVELIHRYARPMAARGRGGVLIMSSVAGFQGSALVAAYSASKAFGASLAEALWDELRDRGVDVLAVCPGPTRTPAFEATRPQRTPLAVMEVAPVVSEALEALGGGPTVVPGWQNRIGAAILRLLPRDLAVRAVGRSMRAIYPHRSRSSD